MPMGADTPAKQKIQDGLTIPKMVYWIRESYSVEITTDQSLMSYIVINDQNLKILIHILFFLRLFKGQNRYYNLRVSGLTPL